jgi:hypothetical protein
MEDHNLHEPLQSAYKKGHNTELALTKIHNDLINYMDSHKGVILVFLDLSAAFDTVDHEILIKRLHNTIGISDSSLSWFQSYLSNRTQMISINQSTSQNFQINYGVPQGSVIGPIDYIIYSILHITSWKSN